MIVFVVVFMVAALFAAAVFTAGISGGRAGLLLQEGNVDWILQIKLKT